MPSFPGNLLSLRSKTSMMLMATPFQSMMLLLYLLLSKTLWEFWSKGMREWMEQDYIDVAMDVVLSTLPPDSSASPRYHPERLAYPFKKLDNAFRRLCADT